jgi:hypothetical protein
VGTFDQDYIVPGEELAKVGDGIGVVFKFDDLFGS